MRKWHRWISVIFGIFMLFIAVTGTLLALEGITSPLRFTNRGAENGGPPIGAGGGASTLALAVAKPKLDTSQALSLLEAGLAVQSGQGDIASIRLYAQDGTSRVEVIRTTGESSHLDALGGQVAPPPSAPPKVSGPGGSGAPPNLAPWRSTAKGWLEYLHRGAFASWPGLIIAILSGISLTVLSITGLTVYWDMYKRRRDNGRPDLFWK